MKTEFWNRWTFWFAIWIGLLAIGSLFTMATGSQIPNETITLFFILMTGWTLHMRLDEIEKKKKRI